MWPRTSCCFRIDPRPAQAALQQAVSAQAKDQATLEQARSQVERYKDIAAKGYLSADQMEQYRTNLGVAMAAVKVDEANVAAAKVTLGYTDIHAPLAGRIGRILIQPGNVVKANDTNALVTINQIEPIFVNFALPSALLGRIQVAQKTVAIGGGGERDRHRKTDRGQGRLRGQRGRHHHRHDQAARRIRQYRTCAVAGPAGHHQHDPRA